jgi:hypothetical protein
LLIVDPNKPIPFAPDEDVIPGFIHPVADIFAQ